MDAKKVGQRLKSQRKRLGLTQKELGEKLMISDKVISRWEQGDQLPTVDMVPSILKVLNLKYPDIFEIEDEKEIINKKLVKKYQKFMIFISVAFYYIVISYGFSFLEYVDGKWSRTPFIITIALFILDYLALIFYNFMFYSKIKTSQNRLYYLNKMITFLMIHFMGLILYFIVVCYYGYLSEIKIVISGVVPPLVSVLLFFILKWIKLPVKVNGITISIYALGLACLLTFIITTYVFRFSLYRVMFIFTPAVYLIFVPFFMRKEVNYEFL